MEYIEDIKEASRITVEHYQDFAKKYEKEIEMLKQIPHLEIPIKYDSKAMLAEGLKFHNSFVNHGFNYTNVPQEFRELGESGAVKGFCITAPTTDPLQFMQYDVEKAHLSAEEIAFKYHPDSGLRVLEPTTFGLQMPETMKALSQLGDFGVAKFISLAGGSVPWHTHSGGKIYPYFQVHFPLETDYGIRDIVRDRNDFQVDLDSDGYEISDIINESPEYEERYEVGKIYVFNSFHYHCMINDNKAPRNNIVYSQNIRSEGFMDVLIDAMSTYSGPLIK